MAWHGSEMRRMVMVFLMGKPFPPHHRLAVWAGVHSVHLSPVCPQQHNEKCQMPKMLSKEKGMF